jgi:thiol:disulfide interchange protein DsbD
MTRFVLLLAAFATGVAAAATQEPLDPDQAFRLSAAVVHGPPPAPGEPDRHGIEIAYSIAPGYYLYRDRFRFQLVPAAVLVGPPEMPPALEIDDPFIGRSAIYREKALIYLPFTSSVVEPGIYLVKIMAQGCAEGVICYSPFPQSVTVTIPRGPARPGAADATRPAPAGIPR